MKLLLAAATTPDWSALLGIPFLVLFLIVVVLLLVNGILWLFLPFVLISKLNAIIRRLSAIESEAGSIARNTTEPSKAANKPSSVRYIAGIND